ncbi:MULTISPECIES: hypothetical protein [Olivibacter]|uniref:Uncharacterized protein n=1 Tax=Olivibacter jilunii TaxID=985016 RepID=A0ABW6AZH2_9SPHI
MGKVDLEKQYQDYLKRMELSEDRMHPAQRVETRRAFMGGYGQSLAVMRDQVGAMPDNEAIECMEDMWSQIGKFWLKEAGREK